MTPRQSRAIAALLDGATHEQAAKAAKVSTRTLRTWMHQDEFKEALREAVGDALGDAVIRLKASAGAAIGALVDIAQDAESEHARVQAAGRLLDANMRLLQDAARGIPSGPAPVFIYDPDERDTAPKIYLGVEPKRCEQAIPPERYEEVERLLLGEEGEQ